MALALLVNFALFGSDGFKSDAALDLNIHDTYFIISHTHFAFLLCVFAFFGVYLVRVLRRNFKNLIQNLILLVSTLLLILILNGANKAVALTIQQNVASEINQGFTDFSVLSDTTYAIQIILLILLAYFGFRTGRNYKR